MDWLVHRKQLSGDSPFISDLGRELKNSWVAELVGSSDHAVQDTVGRCIEVRSKYLRRTLIALIPHLRS